MPRRPAPGPRLKVTFKKNKRADAITMEALYIRGDGAVQVRAVVPLEKARAAFRTLDREGQVAVMGACSGAGGPAEGLAARAAVGLAMDAAEHAEARLAAVLSGFKLRNPFRRKRGAPRSQQKQAPEGGGGEGGGGEGGEGEGEGAEDKAEPPAGPPQQEGQANMNGHNMGSMRLLRGAAAVGVPGAGPTLLAAKMAKDPNAGKVLAKARAGDPKAKAKIHKVRKDAKAGDPEAQHALARLHKVNKVAAAVQRSRRGWYEAGVT